MQKRCGRLVYSPSDLCRFYESEFASWMDRRRAEGLGDELPDPADAQLALLARMGREHEQRHLEALRAEGRSVWEPAPDGGTFDAKHAATVAAMHEGHDVLFQAALRDGDCEGYADFLYRVEGLSRLGAFHYEVADTKLAREPKPYFLLQLSAYARMLEAIQGVRPTRLLVVNGRSEELTFRTDDYFFFFLALERRFLDAQQAFDADVRPIPDGSADHGRWQGVADARLDALDHPCRVAGITRNQIAKLQDAGITTLTALATTKIERVPKMEPATLDKLRAQARLQRGSAGRERPLYELAPRDPIVARHGLALVPPGSPGDVYFDMEGYPLVEGGLEYLFGATELEAGTPRFREFWAHDAAGEKRAFEQLVDWLHARFVSDPDMHVYHYASYEVSALRRLMGKHGTREREVDALLRAQVFVDLYRVVTQAIRVGEPRYSLKNVERLYRPARAGDVATASQSVAEYARWREAPDGPAWETSPILAAIRTYNQEDCESTWKLHEWLLARQREARIAYVAPERKPPPSTDVEPARAAEGALAERLLASIPEDRSLEPERWRTQELLAHLVGFHSREAKPVWWAMFDRQAKTHAELVEDADCLGALTRTATAKAPCKRSFLYEYRFDAAQDTKLAAGSKCYIAESLVETTLETLDTEAGLLTIKLGGTQPEPPRVMSLLPSEHVDAKKIAASIACVAEAWAETGRLPGALQTLLARTPPRVTGVEPGLPLLVGPPSERNVTEAIVNLANSTLAIQGPPGAGKTRVGAAAIVELVARGKRVGIASNSHKAIQRLMEEVLARPGAPSGLRMTKINSARDDELVASGAVQGASGMKEVKLDGPEAAAIVGGTAWAFADPVAVGQFDYLFVDEAGQVSLANLVGMAPAARNLVLMGDQMQLGQPTQGCHPGESGASALEYLFAGRRTVPASLGIFLETTWRLHPALSAFVSGAFYEDRLTAEAHTSTRVVRRGKVPETVTREAGIVFVPVAHEGNGQSSDEEVARVVELVRELRGRALTGATGDRAGRASRIDEDDLLVVAPYNLQVRALRAALPGLRVGSVDKFQGQEAPVVILSMCASAADGSPRGVEFLFSPNRLNVALSRAQSLAIVVGSPDLARARVTTVAQMKLVNLFCRIVLEGTQGNAGGIMRASNRPRLHRASTASVEVARTKAPSVPPRSAA